MNYDKTFMTAHQSLGPARSFFLNEGVLGESRSRVVGEDICISLVTGVAGAYQSGPTDMGGGGGALLTRCLCKMAIVLYYSDLFLH